MVDWDPRKQETDQALRPPEENTVSFRIRAGTEVALISEAVEQIIDRYEHADSSPFLVAAYGLPDSGKSFLLSTLKQRAADLGIVVIGRFDSAVMEGEFAKLPERYERKRYIYVSHHGATAFDGSVDGLRPGTSELSLRLGFAEPNALAVSELGREVDMILGVYNPTNQRPPAGHLYDMLLANESALRKSKD